MFDWPEQIHTSPTRMFLSSTLLVPLMPIVAGFALAGTGSSFTVHLPFASASPVLVWPPKVTVTFVPGVSQPQIGFVCFC